MQKIQIINNQKIQIINNKKIQIINNQKFALKMKNVLFRIFSRMTKRKLILFENYFFEAILMILNIVNLEICKEYGTLYNIEIRV